MLTVTKDEKSSPPKIILSGTIDETTVFDTAFGTTCRTLHIYCKRLDRINSNGIMLWMKYFEKFRHSGGKLGFFEVSPSLISTANYVAGFIPVSEIESVSLPFHCAKCHATTLKAFSKQAVKKLIPNFLPIPCDNCKAEAIFDEIADEYFSFLGS